MDRPRVLPPPAAVALVAAAWLAAVPSPAAAEDLLLAFERARILTLAGEEIEDGVLVVEGSVVAAVGPRASTPVPAGAERHDLQGKVVMPGLVCTHSHIAEPWGADGSAPIQPSVRNLDGINVRSATVQRAQAGGITTVNVMPGSGHLMSGQTTYLKLRDGRTVDDLLLRHADGRPMGGMKMANGTNSQDEAPFPGTRSKSAALVRKAFVDAQEYAARIERAGDDVSKRPARDLDKEALLEVLEGRRVVHHHTHRHDDILTVLRLQEEFGFRLVLQHVSEAYRVVEEIAAAEVPCSLIVIDTPGGKIEALDMSWETGAILEQAGIDVAFHTDDPIHDSRLFLRSAAFAVRAGMSRQGALASVTVAGARMMDLDERLGTLEPGKDADFVVLSGDPLSVYSLVEQTWVEGTKVFDVENPEDRLYAYGGEGASHGMASHLCCYEGGR